ncbi:hypothetical protein GRI40_01075 [Altererythrobacter aerius]|uniref:Uncharacterized protein n=1 Tax=Tsuneonella aeria TaxID=1837929 RepID=A0A6I4TB51_9SPHN|nr:hypothetical protein [Tsuneonella aeria]MXO73816.1 hypothetical protein [Tsuneonella aeria]
MEFELDERLFEPVEPLIEQDKDAAHPMQESYRAPRVADTAIDIPEQEACS